jgi:N-methylhydantoinase A
MHAAELADVLGMERIIVPPNPGVLSTMGLLMTDVRNDFLRTFAQRSGHEDLDAMEGVFNELESQGSFVA